MQSSGGYERLPHRELIARGVLAASSIQNACVTSPAVSARRPRPIGSTPR
jgi:hypothetical protein